MDISKHAVVRSQKRRIPEDDIELIMKFGSPVPRPGGALEYSVKRRDVTELIGYLKPQIRHIDRIANKAVLVVDNHIVTVYHKKRKN